MRPNAIRSRWAQWLAPALFIALLLGLALALSDGAHAQSTQTSTGEQPVASSSGGEQARQALSLQVGGGSYMIGLQYQYRPSDHWVGRAGVGGGVVIDGFPFDETAFLDDALGEDEITEDDVATMVGLPVGASWLPGSGDWRPEVGLTFAPGLIGGEVLALWGGPTAGVRYHPTSGGIYFRAAGQRLLGTAEGEGLGLWTVGLSLGYSF